MGGGARRGCPGSPNKALGCTLCLLTTRAISRTGPVWGRGSGSSSSRPRARVALVVWAWDLFFNAASLLRSPGPCLPTVFRSAICDYLSFKRMFLPSLSVSVPPASAADLPGVDAVLAPPPSVAFAAPVVQAVAVPAGGGS